MKINRTASGPIPQGSFAQKATPEKELGARYQYRKLEAKSARDFLEDLSGKIGFKTGEEAGEVSTTYNAIRSSHPTWGLPEIDASSADWLDKHKGAVKAALRLANEEVRNWESVKPTSGGGAETNEGAGP